MDVIARNALLVDVARRYLGAEPAIWLTRLKWTLPRPDEVALRPPPYKEPIRYDAHAFHYDILDWTSLTLFVYLTDVDQDCCPHVFVEGTHTRKTLREIRRITIDDSIVTRKYKDAVRVILGKKRTAFIEDTSAIHKMSTGRKNRLILSIDYVVNRRPPPERQYAAAGLEGGSASMASCVLRPRAPSARPQDATQTRDLSQKTDCCSKARR